MSRKDIILGFINGDGRGLEIGPSYNPIAPKRDGFDVKILDCFSRDDLVRRSIAQNIPIDAIEDVDYICNSGSYINIIRKVGYYDWIIASHVIEHTPNLIRFLQDCQSLLTPTGVLALAIPDKRYCFDCFRPISGIGKIIDAYKGGHDIHTKGSLTEYYMNVATMNGAIVWSEENKKGEYALVHHDVKQLIENIDRYNYQDCHAWVFTPTSFSLLIYDLNFLGYTSLHEVDYHATEGCEFFIALSKYGEPPEYDRLEMLMQIQEETV